MHYVHFFTSIHFLDIFYTENIFSKHYTVASTVKFSRRQMTAHGRLDIV